VLITTTTITITAVQFVLLSLLLLSNYYQSYCCLQCSGVEDTLLLLLPYNYCSCMPSLGLLLLLLLLQLLMLFSGPVDIISTITITSRKRFHVDILWHFGTRPRFLRFEPASFKTN